MRSVRGIEKFYVGLGVVWFRFASLPNVVVIGGRQRRRKNLLRVCLPIKQIRIC